MFSAGGIAAADMFLSDVIWFAERYHPLARIASDDDFCSSPYASIFVAAWINTKNQRQDVYMLLFDINSWYVAHMPNSYR